jgi:hypothetical protein
MSYRGSPRGGRGGGRGGRGGARGGLSANDIFRSDSPCVYRLYAGC